MKSNFIKFVYGVGYQISSELIRILKTKNLGVKIVILSKDGNRILLVEHSYKRTPMWYLPGGAVHTKERPDEAIRREIFEELGLNILVPDLVGIYKGRRESDDLTFLFATILETNELNNHSTLSEIDNIVLFKRNELPSKLSPGVNERIGDVFKFRKNKQKLIWGTW